MVHRWFYGVALLKLVYRRRNQSRTSQSNVELKTMVSSSDSYPLLESKKHSRNGISIAFELGKKNDQLGLSKDGVSSKKLGMSSTTSRHDQTTIFLRQHNGWVFQVSAQILYVRDLVMWNDATHDTNLVPSGKRLHSYWKSPFIVKFPMKNCDSP